MVVLSLSLVIIILELSSAAQYQVTGPLSEKGNDAPSNAKCRAGDVAVACHMTAAGDGVVFSGDNSCHAVARHLGPRVKAIVKCETDFKHNEIKDLITNYKRGPMIICPEGFRLLWCNAFSGWSHSRNIHKYMKVTKTELYCRLPRLCSRCQLQVRCVREMCRRPPEERNAYTTATAGAFRGDTFVSYRCVPGSRWDGSSPTRRWCELKRNRRGTQTWTKGPGIKCIANKPCGEAPKAANADHNGNSSTPAMGKVTYKCRRGFKPRAGPNVVKTCTGGGDWDGPDIICDDDCRLPPSVMRTIQNGTLTTANASVTYTCNPGFEFPDGTKSKTWTCFDAIFLDAIKTSCRPIKCHLPKINLPYVVEQFGPLTACRDLGTVFVYRCQRGREFVSDDRIRCEMNRTWSGNVTCKLKDCGTPLDFLGAKVTSSQNRTTYGSVVKYECLKGYKMTSAPSSATKTCGEHKKWTPQGDVICEEENTSTGQGDDLDGLDF